MTDRAILAAALAAVLVAGLIVALAGRLFPAAAHGQPLAPAPTMPVVCTTDRACVLLEATPYTAVRS